MPTKKKTTRTNATTPATRPTRPGATTTGEKPPAATPRTGTGARPRPRSVRLDGVRSADALPATPDLPAAAPDTPAARALWAALHTHPGTTGPDLAQAAGIGRSTATNLLATLARAGLAHRTPGDGQGRARQPDRWAPTATASLAPKTAPGPLCGQRTPAPEPVPQPFAPEVAAPPGGKLAGGQLRDLVAEQLRTHPDQELTPAAIAKTLNRSAGAVANACTRLTALGQATQTCAAPRRYQATTG